MILCGMVVLDNTTEGNFLFNNSIKNFIISMRILDGDTLNGINICNGLGINFITNNR